MAKREVLALPKTFQSSKLSLEQDLRRYWGSRVEYKEDSTQASKVETRENLGLLYILLTEYLAQIENTVFTIGDKLLNSMEGESQVTFPLYGKKIQFDNEANWLFIKDMDDNDWYKFDMESNEKFVKSKKENKKEKEEK